MKTAEELNALKEEIETVSRKLIELTDEELEQITGGGVTIWDIAVKLKEKFNNSPTELVGAEKQEIGGKNR